MAEKRKSLTLNWGKAGSLNEEQNAALTKFTNELHAKRIEKLKYDAESTENFSLRFLRARKFDVEKSIKLIEECEEILKKYEADSCAAMGAEACADCDPDVLTTFYPHSQGGIDKQGRLLMWEANGAVSLAALQAAVRPDNLIKYHFWTMQNKLNDFFNNSDDYPQGSGNKVVATTAVLDFDGLNMSHFSQRMFTHLKTLIGIDNVCYPEMLGKMIVVNAPRLATTGWGMIKGWLDPRTQEKIEIHGREASKARLLELIDEGQLPVSLGGTGPEVFSAKPCTSYVAVPRGNGKIERGVILQAGHSLIIDTYVKDDCVSVEAESYLVNNNTQYDTDDIKATFPEKEGDADSITVIKKTNLKAIKSETTRQKQTIEASDTCRFIKITYTNSASWYQRWIVYSFTVMTPSGEALYKVNGSMKKGPLKLSDITTDSVNAEADVVDVNTDVDAVDPLVAQASSTL